MNHCARVLVAVVLFFAAADASAIELLSHARLDYNVTILLNAGDGTFTADSAYAAGEFPRYLCAADFDGDTDVDLAVVNYGGNDLSILLNNGDGTFEAPVNYITGTGPFSACAADLDGDGDTDLAVTNRHGVTILMNILLAPTGVDDAPVPGAFILAQNYPNPFNPSTTIAFMLPRPGPVALEIFDASGRRIRILASGHMGAGAHRVAWDGRDGAGRPAASGVYFCRLRAGDLRATKKMILLK